MYGNRKYRMANIVVILAIPIAVIIYQLGFSKKFDELVVSREANDASKYADKIKKEQDEKVVKNTPSSEVNGSKALGEASDNQKWKILDRWQEKESVSVAEEYRKYYSEEQLLTMAESGSLNAINALVGIYTFGDYQKDKKLSMIKKGIVEGSSYILMTAANFYSSSVFSRYGDNADDAKVQLIESLAYMQLLNGRDAGAIFPLDSLKKSLTRRFRREFGEYSYFSPMDDLLVAKRAQELYEYYESLRLEQGLGTFSSEYPNIVENYVTVQ